MPYSLDSYLGSVQRSVEEGDVRELPAREAADLAERDQVRVHARARHQVHRYLREKSAPLENCVFRDKMAFSLLRSAFIGDKLALSMQKNASIRDKMAF